jgi:hypothetical protein
LRHRCIELIRFVSGQIDGLATEGQLARMRGEIDIAYTANDGIGFNRDDLGGAAKLMKMTVKEPPDQGRVTRASTPANVLRRETRGRKHWSRSRLRLTRFGMSEAGN